MKLAEIYNKAMNRSYELHIMNAICDKLFNQPLHPIRSKAAHKKFLCKHIKKSNRDEVRDQAIDFMLFILANKQELEFVHQVIDIVIREITDRVLADPPEPDVDDFENQYPNNVPPPSNNSAGSSPPSSPQMIPLPPSPDKTHYD